MIIFYILIQERGTFNGMPALSVYSENGKTRWETDDVNILTAKILELRGKLTIYDVVVSSIDMTIRNIQVVEEEPDVQEILDKLNEMSATITLIKDDISGMRDDIVGIQDDITAIKDDISDLTERVEALEEPAIGP